MKGTLSAECPRSRGHSSHDQLGGHGLLNAAGGALGLKLGIRLLQNGQRVLVKDALAGVRAPVVEGRDGEGA